jgi:hypothetical protein
MLRVNRVRGRYTYDVRLLATFVLFALGTVAYAASSVIGAITSASPVNIDKTLMSPLAAPSWPVVEQDEIEASTAPAYLVTSEKNRVTLDPGAIVKARRAEHGDLYLYLRRGGLVFNVRAKRIYICAGGSLFVVKSSSSGAVRMDESGKVTDRMDAGKFEEKGKRGCNDQGVLVYLTGAAAGGAGAAGAAAGGATAGGAAASGAGAVAGATAAGSAAAASGALAAGAAGAAAAGATASSFAATGSNSPCGSAGCNFNPPPVSTSGPQ